MKRKAVWALALAALLVLSGCGQSPAAGEGAGSGQAPDASAIQSQTDPAPEQHTEDPRGLTLTAEAVTDTGLTLCFTQAGEGPTGELQTGSYFWLERWEDGAWQAVETLIPEEELAWDAVAYSIRADADTRMEVNWSVVYGALPDGQYRLGKEVTDFRGTGDYDTRSYSVAFTLPAD